MRGNQCTSHSIAIPLYNLFDWKGQVPQTIYSTSPDCQKYFLQNKCLSDHIIDILQHIAQLTFVFMKNICIVPDHLSLKDSTEISSRVHKMSRNQIKQLWTSNKTNCRLIKSSKASLISGIDVLRVILTNFESRLLWSKVTTDFRRWSLIKRSSSYKRWGGSKFYRRGKSSWIRR